MSFQLYKLDNNKRLRYYKLSLLLSLKIIPVSGFRKGNISCHLYLF